MDVKIQKFKTHFRECTFEVKKLVFLSEYILSHFKLISKLKIKKKKEKKKVYTTNIP